MSLQQFEKQDDWVQTRELSFSMDQFLKAAEGPLQRALSRMGYTGLRDCQKIPVQNILGGRDMLFVSPTSSGKSAVFIIPCLALDKPCLVFSPLVALMRSQVVELTNRGITAAYINSTQSENANLQVLNDWAEGKIQFLYVAPERLRRPEFWTACTQRPPWMVVMDECFTPETEILTENGFVRFDQLEEGVRVAQVNADTKQLSFIIPDEIIRKPYDGKLTRLHSNNLCDLTMTPGHELLTYSTKKVGSWSKVAVENMLRSSDYVMLAAAESSETDQASLKPADRLAIAFQADTGHLKICRRHDLSVAFERDNDVARMEGILQAAEVEYVLSKEGAGKTKRLTLYPSSMTPYQGISKHLGSWFQLRGMSAQFAREFIEEICAWCPSDLPHGQLHYASRIRENVDFVQAVAVLAGYKTNLVRWNCVKTEKPTEKWRLYIRKDRNWIGMQTLKREQVDYKGFVHCVRVSRGNIVVRNNGKPVVIGNCHCLSRWCDTFRPTYRETGPFIAKLRPPVLVACTATCTEEIEQDVCGVLGLSPKATLWAYYHRPNLTFTSREMESKMDVTQLLKDKPCKTIVYFSTIKQLEKYAAELSADGMNPGIYHGKLGPHLKSQYQDSFLSGETEIICATNAFGLGVNITDVRRVIHFNPPGNPEALVQELGRAGRDDKPAVGITFYNEAGWKTQADFIMGENPPVVDIRKVYNVFSRMGRNGTPVVMSNETLSRECGVSTFNLGPIMNILRGHKIVRDGVQTAPTWFVRFIGSSETERFQQYQRIIRHHGKRTPDGMFEFDRDMVASEIGVNHESVAKWLTMWHSEGFIHFHKPTMIKPRIYTGVPMSVIDLERLENRRERAWERLDIVKHWCMAPDDEKQDILKDYFSNWKS